MANQYYRAAFDSDIFYQKDDRKQATIEKPIFNYDHHPKDNVSSLSSYMITEPQDKNMFHKKVFESNRSDVLNIYESNARVKKKDLGPKHHLSKSQVEMGDYDMSLYKISKNKTRSVEKFPKQESARQRKLDEFYGRDSLKYQTNEPYNYTTRIDIHKEPLRNDSNLQGLIEQNYSSSICFNPPLNDKKQAPIQRIKVTKKEQHENGKIGQPLQKRVNFLKSNIFNDPDIAIINSEHNVPLREKKIDAHVIKSSKRANSAEMDQIFDWRESKNNIWLSKYSKEKSLLSAKERKLNEIYGSLNHISLENAREPLSKKFYENKKEIESKAIQHFKGQKQDSIKKQCENMSSLNGTEFYQTNYQLNTKRGEKEEIVHSYEIDNINENDIRQVKKYFSNNGIHVYDTELHDFKMNSSAQGKISVKIRENVNDETFSIKLTKAKETLKKEKGLELKNRVKPAKSFVNTIPQTLRWNDVHIESFLKNRYEDSTDQRTHIKGYGKNNKKEKVTSIPYNLRYKNTFTKTNF